MKTFFVSLLLMFIADTNCFSDQTSLRIDTLTTHPGIVNKYLKQYHVDKSQKEYVGQMIGTFIKAIIEKHFSKVKTIAKNKEIELDGCFSYKVVFQNNTARNFLVRINEKKEYSDCTFNFDLFLIQNTQKKSDTINQINNYDFSIKKKNINRKFYEFFLGKYRLKQI